MASGLGTRETSPHDLQKSLKYYGCWSSTVTRKELTDFASTGRGVLEHWANRRYTVCFVRDLSGELEPNMSETSATGEEIKALNSFTELIGYDDRVVYSLIAPHSCTPRAPVARPRFTGIASGAPEPVKSTSSRTLAVCATASI